MSIKWAMTCRSRVRRSSPFKTSSLQRANGDFMLCTRGKAIGLTLRIFRKTNDGVAGGSVPESAIPDLVDEFSREVNPGGKSFRNWLLRRAKP